MQNFVDLLNDSSSNYFVVLPYLQLIMLLVNALFFMETPIKQTSEHYELTFLILSVHKSDVDTTSA